MGLFTGKLFLLVGAFFGLLFVYVFFVSLTKRPFWECVYMFEVLKHAERQPPSLLIDLFGKV